MKQALAMYLAPTIILLLVGYFILHDKMIDWREKRAGEGRGEPSVAKADLSKVKIALEKLPSTATFDQIMECLWKQWTLEVPEEVCSKVKVFFDSEEDATKWLVSRNERLNQGIPVELCRIPAGAVLVVQLLDEMAASRF